MTAFESILLKNSVFNGCKDFFVTQTTLIYFDTRGYRFSSKSRCEATGTAKLTKRIGFSERSAFGEKSTFLKFGVFQQNRPSAVIGDVDFLLIYTFPACSAAKVNGAGGGSRINLVSCGPVSRLRALAAIVRCKT